MLVCAFFINKQTRGTMKDALAVAAGTKASSLSDQPKIAAKY